MTTLIYNDSDDWMAQAMIGPYGTASRHAATPALSMLALSDSLCPGLDAFDEIE